MANVHEIRALHDRLLGIRGELRTQVHYAQEAENRQLEMDLRDILSCLNRPAELLRSLIERLEHQ